MTEEKRQTLDRFYQGELTIDEERKLIGLLLSDDCPENLKAERHAVIMLARQEAIDVPGDLEEKVLKVIIPQPAISYRYQWLTAVAIALLLMGTGLWALLHKPGHLAIPQTVAKTENYVQVSHDSDQQPEQTPVRKFLTKTVPMPNMTEKSEQGTISDAIEYPDTTVVSATAKRGQPQAVEEKETPSGHSPFIIYPSDPHQRKHLDNRLTAKVYMSSSMAGNQFGLFSIQVTHNNSPYWNITDPTHPVLAEQKICHHQPVRFGLSLRYRLNDRWSMETGLTYTRLSSDITTIVDDVTTTTEQRLNYIGLPLNISYELWGSRRFDLYVLAGGTIEKCLDASPWQFSLNGATGVEYKLSNSFSLYAEPGLGYYFKDGSSTPTIYKDHPLNFNLNFGLRFNLK